MTQQWSAPTANGPVHATVPVPGSKSITNRVLLLAALADGPSAVHAPLRSRDTALMVGGPPSLGVDVADRARRGLARDARRAARTGRRRLRAGRARSCASCRPPRRWPTATIRFDGDPHARQRPMGTVLDALRALGADIER